VHAQFSLLDRAIGKHDQHPAVVAQPERIEHGTAILTIFQLFIRLELNVNARDFILEVIG
jgi:hypothetical protein